MIRVIHGAANLGDATSDSAGRLIVHNHDRFEGMVPVGFEACFHVFGVNSPSPGSRYKLDLDTHSFGEVLPQSRELSRLECEDVVARRKRIYYGSFPGSST